MTGLTHFVTLDIQGEFQALVQEVGRASICVFDPLGVMVANEGVRAAVMEQDGAGVRIVIGDRPLPTCR